MKKHILGLGLFFVLQLTCAQSTLSDKAARNLEITQKVDSVLSLMTLPEKIGQMNQYNGFWEVTGPTPEDGDAAKKYEHLKAGLVGSMLNVRGTEEVEKLQK